MFAYNFHRKKKRSKIADHEAPPMEWCVHTLNLKIIENTLVR